MTFREGVNQQNKAQLHPTGGLMFSKWKQDYLRFRSYGHNCFHAYTLATPFWVFVVGGLALGILSSWLFPHV